jgi:predicted CopG family antitoxin
MVKQLKITLDDNEYQRLVQAKGNLTWKDFVFQLLDFKQKMEQEGEFVPRDSLKEPYVDAAKLLRKLGSLLKVVWKDEEGNEHKENWELEAAALLPLYVSGAELNEEEKRMLLHLLANVVERLVSEFYPDRSDEIMWISQGLRMLALGYENIYEVSIENLCKKLWSGRKET